MLPAPGGITCVASFLVASGRIGACLQQQLAYIGESIAGRGGQRALTRPDLVDDADVGPLGDEPRRVVHESEVRSGEQITTTLSACSFPAWTSAPASINHFIARSLASIAA